MTDHHKKKRDCQEAADCRELWDNCIRPEIAASLGAPVPETAEIYPLISQIAKDIASLAVADATTVIEAGANIDVTGSGTLLDPYVIEGEANFEPAHTKFVAKSWGGVVDETIFFTTISEALAQIVLEDPTRNAENPWTVVIYPGTYAEDVILPSNVALVGVDAKSVTIAGQVIWNAGAAVNAALAAAREEATLRNLSLDGDLSVTTTAKTGASFSFFVADGLLQSTGSISTDMRPNVAGLAVDSYIVRDSEINAVGINHGVGGLVRYLDSDVSADELSSVAAALGDLRLEVQGGQTYSVITSTFSNLELYIESISLNSKDVITPGSGVNISGATAAEILNSVFCDTTLINVADPATLNLGGTQFAQASLSGTGQVARTISHYTATFVDGNGTFAFPVPYLGPYQVSLTQVSGLPILVPTIGLKLPGSFDYTSVGAESYDILVTQSSLASAL